ncbi:hypothetical protein [Kineococcus sp. SYSU DK001]|uniref:hypothetical protein n=1 Tax=Kineococcus sp. SYSU DK001 TaxID=3383122 RepID=UPI003D7EFE8F
MSSPEEPLTRQQRFALRAICIAGSLMALLSLVSLILLWSGGTTRGQVVDALLVVCGVTMTVISGRRLRAAARG